MLHADHHADGDGPGWVAVCRGCRRLVYVDGDGTGRCTIVRYGESIDPDGPPPFELVVSVAAHRGETQVTIVGDLDWANAPLLRWEVERLAGLGLTPTVIELGRLAFLTASGIDVLVELKVRAELIGVPLALRGADDRCRQLFTITGDDHLLEPDHSPASQAPDGTERHRAS